MRKLRQIQCGEIVVDDSHGIESVGVTQATERPARISVHDQRFYRFAALGGSIGAAESFARGFWESPDLTACLQVLARNAEARTRVEKGLSTLLRPVRRGWNWLRRNTRRGSKRNIAAHYDLSNDFFALMLDPTMTYSSGVFLSDESSLEEASTEKYDRVCRKLQLCPEDHVLEIGTGWGGFACHAATNYGCRITTTTISDAQFQFARDRIDRAGLGDRVQLLQKDYRDIDGTFDKLVSLEMIEAVGERNLSNHFRVCSNRLRPEGMMLLQAITIPDHRYARYRRSVDFIQKYIFPGGFLPSVRKMASCVEGQTDMRFFHAEDFGAHYARTLQHWRRNFWQNIDKVRELGFDDRFIRIWHFYLCYCQAGFEERQIGVSQWLLTKPFCRRDPIV